MKNELSEEEISFLKLHNASNRYKEISENMTEYSKNDKLWHLYNILKDEYYIKEDYLNCHFVYNQMHKQLYSEKKYKQALDFLIISLYFRTINIYKDCVSSGFNTDFMYERHIAKYHKDLKKYMKRCNISIESTDEMCDFIDNIIIYYYHDIKDKFITFWISFKFVNYLK